MKKVYVLAITLTLASVAWCAQKLQTIPTLSGDVQEISGAMISTGTTGDMMPQFPTGDIDSWVVPMVSWSEENPTINTGVTAEIKDLIEARQTEPKDTTKLNEEDIGLMEKIIQKIQNIGK